MVLPPRNPFPKRRCYPSGEALKIANYIPVDFLEEMEETSSEDLLVNSSATDMGGNLEDFVERKSCTTLDQKTIFGRNGCPVLHILKELRPVDSSAAANCEQIQQNKVVLTADQGTQANSSPEAVFQASSKLGFGHISETPQVVLYYDALNPQARSCLMLVFLLNLKVDLRHTNLLKGGQLDEEYLKLNPVHTVPTLLHNDLVLTDSHTILMYLCDTFRGPEARELFPSDYLTRLKILNLLFFEAQVLYRRHCNFMTDIVRKQYANVDYTFHERKVLEAYKSLNSLLKNTTYFVGDKLSLADICMAATVSSLDLMFPLDCGKCWPYLYNWFRRMREMPMYCLNSPGVRLQGAIAEKIGRFKFPKKTQGSN